MLAEKQISFFLGCDYQIIYLEYPIWFFTYLGYQKTTELMHSQERYLMLHRQYRL